jgi:hypothetical protein
MSEAGVVLVLSLVSIRDVPPQDSDTKHSL